MKAIAFIDAANLFYGGEKSLGWKIDYNKLRKYLYSKYGVNEIYYFGGIETCNFPFDYLKNDTLPLKELAAYLINLLNSKKGRKRLIEKQLKKIDFYKKLSKFGYKLFIKPVKTFQKEDGTVEKKANCDVEMAYYLMKEKDKFDRFLILSGDGDFLPVLKCLREDGKEVIILARGPRTAKEIKKFAGSEFRDFVRLENELKLVEKVETKK